MRFSLFSVLAAAAVLISCCFDCSSSTKCDENCRPEKSDNICFNFLNLGGMVMSDCKTFRECLDACPLKKEFQKTCCCSSRKMENEADIKDCAADWLAQKDKTVHCLVGGDLPIPETCHGVTNYPGTCGVDLQGNNHVCTNSKMYCESSVEAGGCCCDKEKCNKNVTTCKNSMTTTTTTTTLPPTTNATTTMTTTTTTTPFGPPTHSGSVSGTVAIAANAVGVIIGVIAWAVAA